MGMNIVYHVHFLDEQLPRDQKDQDRFARDYAARLTGSTDPGITAFVQTHRLDPTNRLTISIPARLAEAVRRVEQTGLEPSHRELPEPALEGRSCLIPMSFQIRHFGDILKPEQIMGEPELRAQLAEVLRMTMPGLPPEALRTDRWTRAGYREEDEALEISWESPG